MTTQNNMVRLYGEGKGGGGSQPINDPVTLVAKQAMYALMAISEGELTSLEDIYINDTSIRNFAASFAFTFGLVNQNKIPYFTATSVAEGFNFPITKYELGGLSDGVIRPILGSFEYVDVTIQLNSLFLLDAAGNNRATSVVFAIYTSPSSIIPIYTLVATPAIYGKATQPYPFNIRVSRPITNDGVAEWEIKILRLSGDADQYYNSNSQLAMLTYYSNDIVSNYPGTALVAIRLEDASQVGGSMPTFSFKGHGIKLMLPDSTYYQASTGLYRNIANNAWVSPTDITRASWNGAFNTVAGNYVQQYSNNLSWVIYNLLSDWLYFIVDSVRYPRGFDIPKDYLAKYTFEAFARYCDELLSFRDPITNIVTTERRYTLNRQFFERKDAKIARNEMLSIGNAELIETEGLVSVIWEHKFTQTEIDSSPLFTNQNVIDGKFEYASSDIAENYTQINVTLQEIDNRNRTRTLTVLASELEDFLNVTDGYFNNLYGYQSSDFLLLGCASVAAGIRKGRSILWDSLMTDIDGDGIVQFKTLIEAALLHKGNLIRIADDAMYSTVSTGRLVSYISEATSVTLTLDRAIVCNGITKLLVYDTTGNVLELLLDELSGSHNIVHSTSFGNLNLSPQSLFVQKTDKVSLYKVTNVTHEEDVYTVEAIRYDERKYDYVDSEVILPTKGGFTEIVSSKAEAIYDLLLKDFPNQTDTTHKHFTLSWQHTTLPDRVYRYQIEWSISTGQRGIETVAQKEFDFVQTVSSTNNTYTFTITALSSLDLPSNPVTLSLTERRWNDGTNWSQTDPNDNYAI